jgi:hypothetical protein
VNAERVAAAEVAEAAAALDSGTTAP